MRQNPRNGNFVSTLKENKCFEENILLTLTTKVSVYLNIFIKELIIIWLIWYATLNALVRSGRLYAGYLLEFYILYNKHSPSLYGQGNPSLIHQQKYMYFT